jgi:hypothetical protein
MLEEILEDDFTIEVPEDRISILKDKLKEVEVLNTQLVDLKSKKKDIKDEISAIVDAHAVYDEEDKFKGFTFHPFIEPYVTVSDEGKHSAAVVEIDDSPIVFQIQAQNVTDFKRVEEEVKTRKEIEQRQQFSTEEDVSETLSWVEEQFKTKTRNRVQTRLVTKTR